MRFNEYVFDERDVRVSFLCVVRFHFAAPSSGKKRKKGAE